MRIKTLRSLAIAMIPLLADLPFGLYSAIPLFLGMAALFVCSVLLTEHTPKFVRATALTAALAFLQVILLAGFARAEWLLTLIALLYHALLVLLVIVLMDSISIICHTTEQLELINLCDRTGYLYALHLFFFIGARTFDDLHYIFRFSDAILTLYCIVSFFVLFGLVHTQIKAGDIQEANVDLEGYEAALQDAAELSEDEAEE